MLWRPGYILILLLVLCRFVRRGRGYEISYWSVKNSVDGRKGFDAFICMHAWLRGAENGLK